MLLEHSLAVGGGLFLLRKFYVLVLFVVVAMKRLLLVFLVVALSFSLGVHADTPGLSHLVHWYPLHENYTDLVTGQDAVMRSGEAPFTRGSMDFSNNTANAILLGSEMDGAMSISYCINDTPLLPSTYTTYGNLLGLTDGHQTDFGIWIDYPNPGNPCNFDVIGIGTYANGYGPYPDVYRSFFCDNATTVAPNTTIFYCFTASPTEQKVYRNGGLVASIPGNPGWPNSIECRTSSHDCQLFNSDHRDNNQHRGLLSNAMLWVNYTLTDADVASIYNTLENGNVTVPQDKNSGWQVFVIASNLALGILIIIFTSIAEKFGLEDVADKVSWLALVFLGLAVAMVVLSLI